MKIQQEWARKVNMKENKPYKDPKYGNKVKGKIRGVHYLIYNILRGLPKERGFEPLGEGYKDAMWELDRGIRSYDFNHTSPMFQQLLYPFNETVTATSLRETLR